MSSLLSVTRPAQQNARLKYLPRAKQQIISAHFSPLAVAIPLDKPKYLKNALHVTTFIALPESTFLSSIIQKLEAKLEAIEVQMRYSLLAVGMPQDCACVRRATK
jgi:hypothetical protein